MTIREALARVIDRHNLTAEQMAEVVGEIMDGGRRRPRSAASWSRCA